MNHSLNLYSIKARLILLSIIGLAGLSAILAGNHSFFSRSTSQLAKLQGSDLKTVQIANDLRVGLADLDRKFDSAVEDASQDALDSAVDLAARQRQKILQLGGLDTRLNSGVQQLAVVFAAYVDENRRFAEDVIAGRLDENSLPSAAIPAQKKRDTYDQMLRAIGQGVDDEFSLTLQSLRSGSQEIASQQFTLAALLFLVFALAVIWFIRMLTRAIDNIIDVAGQIADGNLDVKVDMSGAQEVRRLFGALDVMRKRLKQQAEDGAIRQKRQEQIAQLNDVLRGAKDIQALCDDVLRCLADFLGSLVGAFYVFENDVLVLKSTWAFTRRKGMRNQFALGESLVGQAGLEKKLMVVEGLPADYTKVASGLGEAAPGQVLLAPLVLNGKLLGVIELLSFRPFSEEDIELIRRGSEGMAIALSSANSRLELSKALEQTRQQATILQQQQEELRATNEELEAQAGVLRASEESLQQQQEELRLMNEELAERNQLLDSQKEEIARNNAALEKSQHELQEKARQLELSGRYKTEFLSTMSHELRTPLNSILILSQGLQENKPGNLETKQIEHARVIHSSGMDLLRLINDILDLSKVEEGKLELVAEKIGLHSMADKLKAQFDAQADEKNIHFTVQVDENLPGFMVADEQRLLQILRNFLANAFKFTAAGEVSLSIRGAGTGEDQVVFAVQDTGIGIAKEKQQLIFEAFQQLDGTISRKYGGTGLGLTISRKLAERMGGTISVFSQGENQGTRFSLVLPRIQAETAGTDDAGVSAPGVPAKELSAKEFPASFMPVVSASQNGKGVQQDTVLIVADDREFARILQNLAEEYGYSPVCVHSASDAFAYLEKQLPSSVILDLGLPDAPGQQVLAHLKSMPRTRDIPVHVMSSNNPLRKPGQPGIQDAAARPFDRNRLDRLFKEMRPDFDPWVGLGVLVVEDSAVHREQLQEKLAQEKIRCDMAKSGAEALQMLHEKSYGIIILDLDLPDCDGFELLETIGQKKNESTHVIIYTAQDLNKKQDAALRRHAARIVLKTDQSITRLLNETTLFLHWLRQQDGTENQQPEESPDTKMKAGGRILLVDDDIRNLYSLSSVLEDAGLDVVTASTGVEALQTLNLRDDIHLVLMDIMMPEMDGFTAMKQIRKHARYHDVPIIALTAKAMWDDRAHCIEAGANDYLPKPVDAGKLKAIIKLWLQN